MVALKESPTYSESVQSSIRTNTERETELKELHTQEVQRLRQTFQSQLAEQSENISVKEREIQQLKQQLKQVNEELKESKECIAQFEKQNTELEHKLGQLVLQQKGGSTDRQMHSIEEVSTLFVRQKSEEGDQTYSQPKLAKREEWTRNVTLTWKSLKKALCKMERESNAVVDGSIVYVYCSDQEIRSYNAVNNVWSLIPSCPNRYCAIVVVNGLLTTVGGVSGGDYSKSLYSLSHEGQSTSIWREKLPSMPTRRSQSTAFGYLIVAGGRGGRVLTEALLMVEVMDINSWGCCHHRMCGVGLSSMSPSPKPLAFLSAISC